MREMAGLRHSDFIKIQCGNKYYYGGDQAWFSTKKGRDYGCASVAVANVLTYYAKHKNSCKRLYPYGLRSLVRDEYIFLMDEIFRFVQPLSVLGITIGVWPLLIAKIEIKKYLTSIGYKASFKRIGTFQKQSDIIEEISYYLQKDEPIMMLIGINKFFSQTTVEYLDGSRIELQNCSRHWVIITGLYVDDKDEIYIKVSSWGGFAFLKLSSWIKGWWPKAMVVIEL